eukprot:1340178-Rhodomonas_salina.1
MCRCQDFGKVWESCDSKNSDMVPPCCSIKFRIELFQQMDVIFTLIFTFEMVSVSCNPKSMSEIRIPENRRNDAHDGVS